MNDHNRRLTCPALQPLGKKGEAFEILEVKYLAIHEHDPSIAVQGENTYIAVRIHSLCSWADT